MHVVPWGWDGEVDARDSQASSEGEVVGDGREYGKYEEGVM